MLIFSNLFVCVCVCVCLTPEPEIKKDEKMSKAGKDTL